MKCSMPGFHILQYLPEFAQTHVHWVSDAIQPLNPLLPPFSSCLQPFPAPESFPMSWLFDSGGQIIGASASASVLPMNIQDWFPLGLNSLVFLQFKRLSGVFSKTTVLWHLLAQFKSISSLALSLLYGPTLTSIYDYRKNHSLDSVASHSSTLAWKIPWMEEPGRL